MGRYAWGYLVAVLLQVIGIVFDRYWHSVHPGAEVGLGMLEPHSLQWLGTALAGVVAYVSFRNIRQPLFRTLGFLVLLSAVVALTGMVWDWVGHSIGQPEPILRYPHMLAGWGIVASWALLSVLGIIYGVIGRNWAAPCKHEGNS